LEVLRQCEDFIIEYGQPIRHQSVDRTVPLGDFGYVASQLPGGLNGRLECSDVDCTLRSQYTHDRPAPLAARAVPRFGFRLCLGLGLAGSNPSALVQYRAVIAFRSSRRTHECA